MKQSKKILLLGASSLIAAALAGPAAAQTAEQRIVRLEAELRQLRAEVAKQAVAAKDVKTSAERPAYAAPSRAPYNWTGVYGGLFAGGAYTAANSKVAYGAMPGTGVGFGSVGANGVPVKSSWYDTYANGGPSSTTPYVETYSEADCSGFGCTNSNSDSTDSNSSSIRSDSFAPSDVSRRGLVGALGVQGGANYQHGNLVMGLAGDFSWLNRQSDATYSSNGAFSNSSALSGYASSASSNSGVSSTSNGLVTQQNQGQSSYNGAVNISPKWLSTVRLTAGIAQDRFMTFVSGGVAFGSVQRNISSSYSDAMRSQCDGVGNSSNHDWNSEYTNVDCGGTTGYQTAHSSETQSTSANWKHSSTKTKAGFAVGGGFAYALTDVAILKLESYYYNLGKMSMTVNGTGSTSKDGASATPTTVASYKVDTKIHGVLGRVGIDFKF